MSPQDNEAIRQQVTSMTVDSIGKDILAALVQEIKLLPDAWPKMSEAKQNDVIDRLRKRVEGNIKMAVHLIASEDRAVITGDLESITIKDGAKAVFKCSPASPHFLDLCAVQGQPVLIVIAGNSHTAGMHEVKGESDQRAMDLGHEYHDNDGGGMDEDPDTAAEAIEGEILALPAPAPDENPPPAKEGE